MCWNILGSCLACDLSLTEELQNRKSLGNWNEWMRYETFISKGLGCCRTYRFQSFPKLLCLGILEMVFLQICLERGRRLWKYYQVFLCLWKQYTYSVVQRYKEYSSVVQSIYPWAVVLWVGGQMDHYSADEAPLLSKASRNVKSQYFPVWLVSTK